VGLALYMPIKVYTFIGMKLSTLKGLLADKPGNNLRFVLPGGGSIQADFHVTEVGHVARRSIDCGGTKHFDEACVLQVWLAKNDGDHRLAAGKLASILELARPVVSSQDLNVEVEYEDTVLSQYTISSFGTEPGETRFSLEFKHTDSLAREACGLESGCC
jgi:hypothetical protein